MELSEFEKQVSVQYWLDGLKGNSDPHSTRYHWTRNLKRFCDWAGRNPDELIAERKQQLKSDDPRVAHQAEQVLKRAVLPRKHAQKREPHVRTSTITMNAVAKRAAKADGAWDLWGA